MLVINFDASARIRIHWEDGATNEVGDRVLRVLCSRFLQEVGISTPRQEGETGLSQALLLAVTEGNALWTATVRYNSDA